jgi:hypothetical protein
MARRTAPHACSCGDAFAPPPMELGSWVEVAMLSIPAKSKMGKPWQRYVRGIRRLLTQGFVPIPGELRFQHRVARSIPPARFFRQTHPLARPTRACAHAPRSSERPVRLRSYPSAATVRSITFILADSLHPHGIVATLGLEAIAASGLSCSHERHDKDEYDCHVLGPLGYGALRMR